MKTQTDATTAAPVRCGRCARHGAEDGLLTWSHHRDRRGESWLCEACTRESIGCIESGLDDLY